MITKRDFILRGICFCEKYIRVEKHNTDLVMPYTHDIDITSKKATSMRGKLAEKLSNNVTKYSPFCIPNGRPIRNERAQNPPIGDTNVSLCALYNVQSCTQIIRPLARFYSYDYDLRKTNNILKWLHFKEIER